jgi:hypothetical protein
VATAGAAGVPTTEQPSSGAPAVSGTGGSAGGGVKPPIAIGGSGGAGVPAAGQAGQLGQAGQTAAAGGGGTSGAQAGTSAAGSGGTAGTSAAGTGGAAGGGATSPTDEPAIDPSCATWPKATGDEPVVASIRVSGSYDGKLKRYAGAGALGAGGQEEGQDPLFLLSNGATLENVILGAPGADGIHCEGSCTLRNVWWEDVGEDAATLKGSSGSQVMSIECGGARMASDKVFQHNGPGTMRIQNFSVDDFGKLYRSCGNCSAQHERHVEMKNIDATKGLVLAGINTNYGDTAKFEHITLHDSTMKLGVCDRYTGNSSGDEPKKTGSGADGSSCIYEESAIIWAP